MEQKIKVRIHIHIDHKVTWVIKISQQCLYDVKLIKNRFYTLILVIRPRSKKYNCVKTA